MKLNAIKSFVMRGGRLTKRQQLGFTKQLAHYELPVTQGVWDLKALFPSAQDVIVEIGFGMGHALVASAKSASDTGFIGIEVHHAGLGAVAADLFDATLQNVRLCRHDAVMVFRDCIPDDSLSAIHLFFPDPWPKKKHHKRRIVQQQFVALMRDKLKLGGVLHCATDWAPYAQFMLEEINQVAGLHNLSVTDDFVPRPESRPMTKFERRGQRLGHGIWDVMFEKKDVAVEKTMTTQ